MDEIEIKIKKENMDITLTSNISDCIANLPYSIADLVTELIKQTDINSDIVIEQLIDEFGYKDPKLD